MGSLLSNTPPVPVHEALEKHSSALFPHIPQHSSVHLLSQASSPLNAEKRASVPAVVPLSLDPGPLDQGCSLLQRGKWQIFPVSGRRLSLFCAQTLSLSITLASFPLLPCSVRCGAGAGGGSYGVGVLFGGG